MGTGAPGSTATTAVLATAVGTAGGIAALEIAGLSARDGLFLSQLPASRLPAVMVGAGVVSLVATLGVSRWMRVSRPDRVAPIALLATAASLAGIGALLSTAPRAAAVLLYVQVAGLGPVVVSSFWSVVNERFDPYQAKKVVARMAAAGALGGVAGGGLAERVTTWIGLPTLLFALAAVACACAFATRQIGAGPDATHPAQDESVDTTGGSGLALLRRIGLLRGMATLMLTVAAVETLVEYALKVEAARSFQSDEELVRFFALFYTGCGLLAFGIQSSLGDRFLRRFGLAGAVAMLPASVALLGLPAVVMAKLWTVTLARGAETLASTAFFRAGFQLLYTPMSPAVKRPAKVWVDVAAGSAGDILGAALIFGLLFALPELPTEAIMLLVVLGAVAALAVVRGVRQGYVSELTDSLRRGRIEIRKEDALDRTTLQTIATSQSSGGRLSLLERVRAFDAEQSTGAPGPDSADAASEPKASGGEARSFSDWPSVLESGDPAQIRAALGGKIDGSPGATPERRLRLVAFVIPLLGEAAPLARAARDYLRPLAPRAAGQLCDALLDASRPRPLRTRVAWILGGIDDARAAEGLWRAAADESFPVRVASVRALARICARRPEHAPAPDGIHAAVLQELEVDDGAWATRRAPRDDALGERSVLLSPDALARVPAALEHVFTMLAIAHDRTLLASALAGLASDDGGLRGTALELLESVLPAPVRRALWPRLEAASRARAKADERSRQQIASELIESAVGQVIDLDALGRSS